MGGGGYAKQRAELRKEGTEVWMATRKNISLKEELRFWFRVAENEVEECVTASRGDKTLPCK